MSTTKIINGFIPPSVVSKLDHNPYCVENPLWEMDLHGNSIPATLYIGTGKMWTEEEVRAMLREMVYPATVESIAAKHGLTL